MNVDPIHQRFKEDFAVAEMIVKVTENLARFAGLPHELTSLIGEYRGLTPARGLIV